MSARTLPRVSPPTVTPGDAVLDHCLRSLQISGPLLLHEAYVAPWAVSIPPAHSLAPRLGVRPGARAVVFHLVESGECVLKMENGTTALLQAGDIAVCFGGAAHRIGGGNPLSIQPVEDLLDGQPGLLLPPVAPGQAADVALLCGAFVLAHGQFSPLLEAMPPLLHVRAIGQTESGLTTSAVAVLRSEMAGTQPASGFIVERLLEVLCAQAIQAHLSAAQSVPGWPRAIRDQVVGQAMSAIHAQPGAGWSVRRMATQVAMSPSRFAARFSASLGASPMAYVTRLRMHLACRQLVTTESGVDQIAAGLGYTSTAAFTRAFKSHVGLPPGAWRMRDAIDRTGDGSMAL